MPESSSLLEPALHAAHEQKQGRAMIESFDLVYEFTSAKKFQDEDLIQILHGMRTGTKMPDPAWKTGKP